MLKAFSGYSGISNDKGVNLSVPSPILPGPQKPPPLGLLGGAEGPSAIPRANPVAATPKNIVAAANNAMILLILYVLLSFTHVAELNATCRHCIPCNGT